MSVPSPIFVRNISLNVASASDFTFASLTSSRMWSGMTRVIFSAERSGLTPWKTGKENRGPRELPLESTNSSGRRLTRWVVAVQMPPVRASRARPMLTTNVFGTGGAGIQSPALFCTSRPRWGVACKRNVRKPESLCAPTPWNPVSLLLLLGGGGYLINLSLCCCGLSKASLNAVGGRSRASAMRV